VDFLHLFWTKAIIETPVKLGKLGDSILALLDHGSEINIMNMKIYNKSQ
jgi:hypothetical protein